MATEGGLNWYEYVIFGVTLAVSTAIGIYFAVCGGKQRTVEEYLVGNRRMAAFPVGASIGLSIFSAIYILGSTAEIYLHGVEICASTVGCVTGMILATVYWVPLFYKLKITSLFEVKWDEMLAWIEVLEDTLSYVLT